MSCNANRFCILSAIVLALAIVVSACGPAVVDEPGPDKELRGEIVYGMTGDPVIFNPLLATDVPSSFVYNRIFAGLVRSNESLEIEGYLAHDWGFSDDGLVWTFYLRDDVYWHDGEKLTADDVVFTFNTILHPDYPGVRKSDYRDLEKIEAEDDYTVVFHLTQPFAPFLTRLTIGIIPQHIFEEGAVVNGEVVGTAVAQLRENPYNHKPIGTGPYMWGEWRRDEYLTLVANDSFFLDGPWIQQVRIRFVPDNKVLLAELEAGGVDYMGAIPIEDIDRVKAEMAGSHNFWQFPNNGYQYIGLKQDHPILKDVNVRKALMYAMDRDSIIEDIFGGYGTVMNSNYPPISWAYSDDIEHYTYDPDKAVQLLEAAGWTTVGADGVRRNAAGDKLTFSVVTATGSQESEDLLLTVQYQWAQLGIDAKPEFYEWSVLLEEYLDRASFEAYQLGWSLGLDPDPYIFFHSSQAALSDDGYILGFNDVGYKNDRVDKLLEDGRKVMDPGERTVIYHELQQILNDELPYLFLYTRDFVTSMHKKFGGVVLSPLGPIFPEQWYLVGD